MVEAIITLMRTEFLKAEIKVDAPSTRPWCGLEKTVVAVGGVTMLSCDILWWYLADGFPCAVMSSVTAADNYCLNA